MPNQTIDIPLSALKILSGDQIKIYLGLKQFIKMGGHTTVNVDELSEVLKIDADAIRLNLLYMVVKGWMLIDLSEATEFFDDKKLKNANWTLLHEQERIPQEKIPFLRTVADMQSPVDSLRNLFIDNSISELFNNVKIDAGLLVDFHSDDTADISSMKHVHSTN